MTSNGSKPRSSSCCLLDEPKPKAACQSVEEATGIVSGRGRVWGGEKSVTGPGKQIMCSQLNSNKIHVSEVFNLF